MKKTPSKSKHFWVAKISCLRRIHNGRTNSGGNRCWGAERHKLFILYIYLYYIYTDTAYTLCTCRVHCPKKSNPMLSIFYTIYRLHPLRWRVSTRWTGSNRYQLSQQGSWVEDLATKYQETSSTSIQFATALQPLSSKCLKIKHFKAPEIWLTCTLTRQLCLVHRALANSSNFTTSLLSFATKTRVHFHWHFEDTSGRNRTAGKRSHALGLGNCNQERQAQATKPTA